MPHPKVLVSCPTADYKRYCLNEYADAVKSLSYLNYDILIVDNSKDNTYFTEIMKQGLNVIKGPYFEGARDRIVHSRNIIRDKVLAEGYDYFFSLEQDVIPEKNVIEQLLKHNMQIVSGVVYNNLPVGNEIKLMPMVYVAHPKDPTGLWYADESELRKSRLMEAKACGLSCVLIHKSVLEKIKFRHALGFDDMMFCKDAIEQGFKIYADTDVRPKHLNSTWIGVQK